MSTPNKPTAEEMRNKYRNAKPAIIFFLEFLGKIIKKSTILSWLLKPWTKPKSLMELLTENIPYGRITIYDLIVGPDFLLGPNQIALREEIIDQSLNGGLLRMSASFSKEAETMSSDENAKGVLSFLRAFSRGDYKKIETEIDLHEIFDVPKPQTS